MVSGENMLYRGVGLRMLRAAEAVVGRPVPLSRSQGQAELQRFSGGSTWTPNRVSVPIIFC